MQPKPSKIVTFIGYDKKQKARDTKIALKQAKVAKRPQDFFSCYSMFRAHPCGKVESL